VPRAAGDFSVIDSSGKSRKISDYRGQVVVVQFLYTTCQHCQATARMLSGLQKELRGLQVVGVAFEPGVSNDAVVRFMAANGVEFPVGAASSESVMGYLGLSVMERFVVPQILIIDRKGVVRAQSEPMGSPELQDEGQLRSLLKPLLGAR
jgi:peroxiredoxin